MRLILTVLMLLVLRVWGALSLVVATEPGHVVIHVVVVLDIVLYVDSFEPLRDDGPVVGLRLVVKLWMMVMVVLLMLWLSGGAGGRHRAVVEHIHSGGDDLVGCGGEGVGRLGLVLHQGPLKDGARGGGRAGGGGVGGGGARHCAGREENAGAVEMVGRHERLVGGGGRVVVGGRELVGVW